MELDPADNPGPIIPGLPGAENWPEAVRRTARRLTPLGLFPAQRELLQGSADLCAGASALLLAPTGSGKSVVGMIALLGAVARGRVGMILSPTRALARELHAHLATAAEGTGLSVALSTRESRGDDDLIAGAGADLVVAVYEKGLALLRHGGRLSRRLGALVLDEVQILFEESRGGAIETGMVSILASLPHRPQVLAMSSCLARPADVSAWLGVPMIRSESRPVPLREGLFEAATGLVRWSDGTPEPVAPPATGEDPTGLGGFLEAMGAAGRRVLLFVPTRRMAWELSGHLAARSAMQHHLSQATLLDAIPGGAARRALEPLLSAGVAPHTSELPRACRVAVEDAFREGTLRVLVATPTLAQGVNLRADVVLHWPEAAGLCGDFGGFAPAPVSRAQFTNAGGRAGRPGGGAGEGWALVLARDGVESRRLFASLFGPPAATPVEPPPRPMSLESLAWLFPQEGSAESLALRCLAAGMMTPPSEAELDLLLAEGVRLGLWKTDAGAVFRLTGAGRALARGGCRASMAARWARLLWGTADEAAPFSLLLLACEGIVGWFPGLDRRERPEETRAWRRIRSSRDAVGRARAGGEPPTLSAAHRALVAETLLGEEGIAGAEERHGLLGGTLEELAAEVAWQLELIAGLADHYRRPVVANLARRLAGALGGERTQGPAPVRQPLPGPTAPVAPPAPPSTPARAAGRLEFTDAATGLVRFDGREVRLPPIRFDFLLALAEAGPAGVSKNDLVLRLWGAVPREEQQLFYHRREMERALLGREPAHPGELIETLPKWGFRLRVESMAGVEAALRRRPRAAQELSPSRAARGASAQAPPPAAR